MGSSPTSGSTLSTSLLEILSPLPPSALLFHLLTHTQVNKILKDKDNLVFPRSELELESRSAETRMPAWSPPAQSRVEWVWVVPPYLNSLKEPVFLSLGPGVPFGLLVLACGQVLFQPDA